MYLTYEDLLRESVSRQLVSIILVLTDLSLPWYNVDDGIED